MAARLSRQAKVLHARQLCFMCLAPLPRQPMQATLAAALPPGVLHQEAAFAGYEEAADGVTLHFHGGQQPPVTARLLIGADGAQSGVREQLLGDGPPTFLGARVRVAGTHVQVVAVLPIISSIVGSELCLAAQLQAEAVLPPAAGSAIWRGVAPQPSWWPGPGTYCLWLQQPRILRAFPLPGIGLVVWQVGSAACTRAGRS